MGKGPCSRATQHSTSIGVLDAEDKGWTPCSLSVIRGLVPGCQFVLTHLLVFWGAVDVGGPFIHSPCPGTTTGPHRCIET